MTRVYVNGLNLNLERRGKGPPLLLLHGFTGSSSTWDFLSDQLSTMVECLSLDLPGHGRTDSPWTTRRYRIDDCVADILALLDALDIGRVHLLGYSMGGRVALHLALAEPTRVDHLILESTSPGIEMKAERLERVQQDESLATFIEQEGIANFVRRWESQPLFSTQNRLPSHARSALHAQRLSNTVVGLAGSLRGLGAGVTDPVTSRLSSITSPTLLIAGALDEKYRRLAECMVATIPNATLKTVSGAGHAVHLEQPTRFVHTVSTFLSHSAGNANSGAQLHHTDMPT